MNKFRIVLAASLFFIFTLLTLFALSQESQKIIILENKNYSIYDTVNIFLNYSDLKNTRLDIYAPEKKYSLLDPKPQLKFIPRQNGKYVVEFMKGNSLLDSTYFFVGIAAEEQKNRTENISIITDKLVYFSEDPVFILLPDNLTLADYSLEISTAGRVYKTVNLEKNITFSPLTAGDYKILLKKGENIAAQTSFSVIERSVPGQEIPVQNESIIENLSEFVERPLNEKGNFKIKDRKNNDMVADSYLLEDMRNPGKFRHKFRIGNAKIKEIEFNNLNISQNSTLKIDFIEKKINVDGKKSISTYAIDPTSLSFDNATVTVTATGTELWKCKDWDYNQQTCLGSWVKLQDLTPGENYTFLLDSQDPGFAETGVATVNTKKPIYHPGEKAEFIMVVLNKFGYPAPANVTLTIIKPNGNSVILNPAAITQIRKGVYEASYEDTSQQGGYALFVNAIGENVGSNLTSSFEVKDFYDFDILRESSVVIDPWNEPIVSKIKIASYSYAGEFSLTETLPGNFEVYDYGNAIKTIENGSILLVWHNLNNNSVVSYSAYAPKISPDLYELRSYITFNNNVFMEARPWYVAIDPRAYSGIFVYKDTTNANIIKYRIWNSTTQSVGAEQSGPNVGSPPAWQKIRCMEQRPQCLWIGNEFDNTLDFTIYNESLDAWDPATNLGTIDDDYMMFDVECEGIRGDCLVMYEKNKTPDNKFFYRIYSAATGTLGSEVIINTPNATNNSFWWIKSYPKYNNNTIALLLQNNQSGGGEYEVGIWNGTNFTNWQELFNDNSDVNYRTAECAWEGASGDLICFYTRDTLAGIYAWTWNASSSIWTDNGEVWAAADIVEEPANIEACGETPMTGDLVHNKIILMAADAGSDRLGSFWNDSSVITTSDPTQDGSTEWVRDDTAVCLWEHDGVTAVMMWVDNGATVPEWGTFDASTESFSFANWGSGSTTGSPAWSDDVESLEISLNPENDEILLTGIGLTTGAGSPSEVECTRWNGTSFDATNCGNMDLTGATDTAGSREFFGYASVDWSRYNGVPIVSALIYPADTMNVTAAPINFTFTVGDDLGIKNCSIYLNISNWTQVGSSSSINNSFPSNITVEGLSDGRYTWNVLCFDISIPPKNASFSSNYTFRLDFNPPNVTNLSFSPNPQIVNLPVNITARLSDFIGVGNVTARIILPNLTDYNLSMGDSNSDGIYDVLFNQTKLTGQYNVSIRANDTFGNINSTTIGIFNISLESLSFYTDNSQYASGETVFIFGKGFNSSVNVTVYLFDPTGDPISGFPRNVSSNTTGGINTSWVITGGSTLGIYTLNATETIDNSRSINSSFEVVAAIIETDRTTYEQGDILNITGSIWDVNVNVTINITDLNNITVFGPLNVSSNSTGNINYTWRVPYNETTGLHTLYGYEPSSPAKNDDYTFTVTTRTINLTTQFPWYRSGERVNISGNGFSIPSNVTIVVYNSAGSPLAGYPKNITVNATGYINDSFLVSGLAIGVYFINATDVIFSNLKKNYNFSIVNPNVSTNKQLFTNGETVYLTGAYWDRFVNVTINILNQSGLNESGFPRNVSTNSTGGFAYTFTARADQSSVFYNVSVNQTYQPARNATTNFTVIRQATLSLDKSYYVQLELVNISGRSYTASDNVSVRIKSNDNGGTAFYYPQNNLTDSSGNFNHYFNISDYCSGNYMVIATDEENPSLSNLTANFTVRGWWNSSWKKRKPIYLTNYLASSRNNERVYINITGLANDTTDCVNETRIISTITGQEVTLNIIAGDNRTYCEVSFLANMTMSSTNESIYYVYYNNTIANNPNYPALPLYSYYQLYDGFESGSDFLYTSTTCPVDGSRECQDSSPWDDFTDCIETDGAAAYGICTSDYMGVVGSRGFMSNAGLDRNTANNALYAHVNKSACGDLDCDYVNLSYYQAAALLEVAAPVEGSGVFVNNSDGILRLISNCVDGEACENGAAADMRGFQEYVSAELCNFAGVNCTVPLTLRFSSANVRSHTNGDYFGWDEINITGYRKYAGNVSSSTGSIQSYFECRNIDVTSPNITINSPPNYFNTSDISPEINFTITDDIDTILNYTVYVDSVYSTLNGTASNNTLKSINMTNLTQGKHVIIIEAKDDYSNARNSTPLNITIDTSGPQTNITAPQNRTNISGSSYLLIASSYDNLTDSDTVTFLYRASNLANWTFACKDARDPFQCTWDTSLLADGNSYEIRAYANDTVSNIGGNFTVYNVTLDRTGPFTNITDPVNFTNITAEIYVLMANASDNFSGVDTVTFQYRKNNTAVWTVSCRDNSPPYTCNFNSTDLTEGNTYQFSAFGNDTLGNIGTNFTAYNVSVNMRPPAHKDMTALPSPQKLGLPVNITSNITDVTAISYVEARVVLPNGTQANLLMTDGNQDSIFNVTFRSGYIIGNYNVTVFSNDTFSNYNSSALFTFTIEYESLAVSTNNPQYVRGEIVYIKAKGYGAFNNATIYILNSSGNSMSGFPYDIQTNSTGGTNDSWLIPISQDLGTYYINLSDKNDINRSYQTSFEIVAAIATTSKSEYEQAELVNITGLFWDASTIVELNITDPNGDIVFGPYQVNSNSTGGIYANWTPAYNATTGIYLLSAVEPSNPSKFDAETFTITQRSVFVFTDASWYKEGYIVYIKGYGFSNFTNVTVNIYNESGISISSFPRNVSSNSTGGMNTSFTVNNLPRGNYTVNATDNRYYNLNNFTLFEVLTSTLATDKSSYVNGETIYITGTSWTRQTNITIDVRNVSDRSITGYPKNVSSDMDGALSDSLTAVSIGLGSTLYNVTAFNPQNTRENVTINFTVLRRAVVAVSEPRPDINVILNVAGTFFSQGSGVTFTIRYANSSGYVNYFPKKITSNSDGNISYTLNTTELCKGYYVVEATDDAVGSLYGNITFNVTHLNPNTSLETLDNSTYQGSFNILGGSFVNTTTSDNDFHSFGGADFNSNFNGYINYTFNLTQMNPFNVSNITFRIEYCHSGVQANPRCSQGFAHEGNTTGQQRVEIYNFSNNAWFNVSSLAVNDTSDNEQILIFSFDRRPQDFIQNNRLSMRLQVNFTQEEFNDDALVVDFISANFTYASEVNKPCTPLGSSYLSIINYNKTQSAYIGALISVFNGSTAITTGNGSYLQYFPSGNNLTVRVILPLATDNVSFQMYNLNFSGTTAFKTVVDENYSFSYPGYTQNVTPFLVVNDTNMMFTKAQVQLPKRNITINSILHCLNFNYSNNECLSFEVNDSLDYEFNEDADYIYFNVTSFDSFGGGGGASIPNVTNISVYNVTGLFDQKSGGILLFNKLNTTFNFSSGNTYRIEFRIFNPGARWDIVAADVAYQSGLNETWYINTTRNIWYIDNASSNVNRTGGNFTNGKVVWNTSKAGRIGANRVGHFFYVVNITTNRSENYPVFFLINDTSSSSGSYDYSIFRIRDVIKPFIVLNKPFFEDNLTYGSIVFNWTPVDNTFLNNTCDLIINGIINQSNISSQNNQSKTLNVAIMNAGRYNWSMNCSDYDRNFNISDVRNFTVIAGPVYMTINLTSANSSIRINWSSSQFAVSYNVYITTNYSQGFSSTPNATNITDLNWTDQNAFDSGRRYYQVAAVRGGAVSAGNETVGKQTLQLYTNWNLISLPFNLTNWQLFNGTNGRDIFTSPGDCIISLWRYNSSNQSYQKTDYANRVWTPSAGSENFASLEKGLGYWAEVNQYCNLTFMGIVPRDNSTFALNTYWDLTGHYSSKDPELGQESVIKPIDVTPQNSVEGITRYNSATNSFEVTVYYPGYGWFPSFNNQDFIYLSPLTGYYFDLNQPTNWTHDPTKG